MDKLKQYVTFAVLASVAVLAAGWFLLVSPQRAEAASLRAQAEEQVAANAMQQTQLQVLQAKSKDLPKKQAELARVAAKIPSNPAMPGLIRALTAASTSSGVEFVSIVPGTPVPFTPAAPVAPVAPASGGDAAPVPAAAPDPAGPLTSIPFVVTVVGNYTETKLFLSTLETLPRALRVTNLVLAPGVGLAEAKASPDAATDGRSLNSVITGSIFMASATPAAAAVVPPVQAAAAAPAAAPAGPAAN